jgi:hypothetical protein
MRRIKPGDKVKVYCNDTFNRRNQYTRYGEVLGINGDHKLLLHERKDFATHQVSSFQHFRQDHEVVFLAEAQPALRNVQLTLAFQINPIAI